MLLMLVGMATWAQDWEAPSENEYQSSTPVYVQVNVNGEQQMKAQVAAFIDDDCRAVSNGAEAVVGNNQYHLLRVWGDPNADENKTISFKVAWEGLVFNFTKTVTFTGETHQEIPVVLNVDMPTGVSLTNPLNIEAKLPYTHDLMPEVKFTYSSGAPVEYTPLGESKMEHDITYEWDFANSSSYFTVLRNQLTATAETGEGGAYLGLSVRSGAWNLNTFTTVYITQPVVPVQSITCEPATWNFTTDDNLYEHEALNAAITVLPEDASNKGYFFEAADEATREAFAEGEFINGGTYRINIVSAADESIKTTITAIVTVPIGDLANSCDTEYIYATVGENVFDLITPYIEVYPENATNKAFNIHVPAEASDAIVNGVALRPGVYTLEVRAEENPEVMTEATVLINAIEAPESITLNIGELYRSKLENQIQVLPVLDNIAFTYSVAPKTDADAEGFGPNGDAVKAGTYTLLVTCNENPKATAEIQVTVLTPVTITYPSSIVISKFEDRYLELTLVEGDNFNPELIEIESWAIMDEMPYEPVTFIPVPDTNNLKWAVRGYLCGRHDFQVLYNGEPVLNVDMEPVSTALLPVEIKFNNDGWDWITYPSGYSLKNEDGNYHSWLNQDENNRIIDLRSQRDLLYNDPTHGLFGSIDMLRSGEGMYKIKAKYDDPMDAVFVGSTEEIWWDSYFENLVVKGYNWISYPKEWDLSVDEFNTIVESNHAEDGDIIIGKNGFASFDALQNKWIAQEGFYFQAGKGYIYYSVGEAEKYLNFNAYPSESDETQSKPASRKTNIWQYDAGAFADNMAIVAELEGLQNPEQYTIGAFVNGECRGEGNFVSGNKMMISVAGKSGEDVTFRLYNTVTGQISEIVESVKYSQMAGSLKNPVKFSAPSTTGIENIITGVDGNVSGVYDLNGRKIENVTKPGVYVIKTDNGTKKVVVK